MSLVTASDGTLVAEYEYGPFGETLKANGALAVANTFRFSTKAQDESGLVYYGYRYYDPETGRWTSRDPIGEQGGYNVFAFCGNNGVLLVDSFGLQVLAAQTCDQLNAYEQTLLDILKKNLTKAMTHCDAETLRRFNFWDITGAGMGLSSWAIGTANAWGQPASTTIRFAGNLQTEVSFGGYSLGIVSGVGSAVAGVNTLQKANSRGDISMGIGQTGLGVIGTANATVGLVGYVAPTLLIKGTLLASVAAPPVGFALAVGTTVVVGLDVVYAAWLAKEESALNKAMCADALRILGKCPQRVREVRAVKTAKCCK